MKNNVGQSKFFALVYFCKHFVNTLVWRPAPSMFFELKNTLLTQVKIGKQQKMLQSQRTGAGKFLISIIEKKQLKGRHKTDKT